ncbi:TAXI family TRAP transporter solute-binding subunit [Microbacterium esteraromaticum]|uniref:TAXI family TRAP transporter solute-binding subunit n=1 Tax=Microbacterium esteraromaticum TaxID=57043 RepID=A0A7D8ABQ0_9MICO|nr:TAXI family TRAP transporter solute-binding subunit [Microbacterium esteraromaticum]QMU95783.1 TAXI family TRAP transporter solute-binding subunit [Microbacterium esteraromaticum]
MTLLRRALAACVLASLVLMTGCTPSQPSWAQRPIRLAGGSVTGVYYDYGQRLVEALSTDLDADARFLETNGSVDNLRRIGAGEAELGFAQSDVVADAVSGTGEFGDPLPIRAVARLYDEYVHVVVRADSAVQDISDLAGRPVSLGARGSGVSVVANRVLAASGIATSEVDDRQLGLDASIAALEDSRIDAFFWVGGLPTPGIERLAAERQIRLLSIDADAVERAGLAHPGVYRPAEFPVGAYGSDEPTSAMTVPNYLVGSAQMPDPLVSDVLGVLFASRVEIAEDVPAAALLDRRLAIFTDPIPLHPGAIEYYRDAHR